MIEHHIAKAHAAIKTPGTPSRCKSCGRDPNGYAWSDVHCWGPNPISGPESSLARMRLENFGDALPGFEK